MNQELQSAFEDLLGSVVKMRNLNHFNSFAIEGLTPVEMRVLVCIYLAWGRSEEVRPGMVASELCMTKSALSQVLRPLEEKGYIERRRSERDSRAVVLAVSDLADARIKSMRGKLDQEMSELIAFIGLDDLRHLKKTVDKIVAFKEMREKDLDGALSSTEATESSASCTGPEGEPGQGSADCVARFAPHPFLHGPAFFDCFSKDEGKPCE
ncbi:MAG: MarR family winged helix-turn-helix transcriptional regulator [Coriobacteriia bacterium]|nr:MarR family winged helix-turn-helix transcriptional regulator [Coriobacteriia bacterium]